MIKSVEIDQRSKNISDLTIGIGINSNLITKKKEKNTKISILIPRRIENSHKKSLEEIENSHKKNLGEILLEKYTK